MSRERVADALNHIEPSTIAFRLLYVLQYEATLRSQAWQDNRHGATPNVRGR
jgi:hypothetical protein